MSLLRLDRLHYCILMSMGCISSPLVWAEDLNSDVAKLPTLHVEATRTDTGYLQTPASVFRIEAPQVDSSSQVNLTEVVKGIPSLQIRNRENYAQDLQLSMRGFGARSTFGVRGIRLYVDGIPATMPDGQGQTSNIDLSSLDHVEVLTGPFSSLYGNSSGGTILTSTKEGQGKDSIELSYSGGSHDKSRAGLVLQGGAKGANEPSYIISSSYFDTDGYREHSGAEKVLNNAKLSWNLDDGSKINWVTNYVKINADDPGGLTRADWQNNPKQVVQNVLDYNARKEIEQTQTGLTWSKPINDQHELYAMTYMGQRQVTQYQSIPDTVQKNPNTPYQAGGVIDFKRNYYGADFRWTGKELLPNTTLSIGVALDAMKEDRQGYQNFNDTGDKGVKGALRRDEDNTLWNIDPYVQASWQFLPTWRLDTGVRYSNVHYKSKDYYIVGLNGDNSGKTSYEEVLPSVALSWQITPEVLAYASYAKGFETPTFTEMAYPAQGGASTLDLKPSTSDTYETGLKSQNQLGDFTLAVFQTKTKNDIVSAESFGGRSTFRNADKTLREGVEFAWNKKLWRDLTAIASYTYLDATFDSTVPAAGKISEIPEGNAIPGIAKNQAYVSLAWQPSHGLYGGVDVQYMDKVYVNDTNSDAAPSYSVTSANIGYAWVMGDWKVNSFARVDNLFDKKYAGSVIVNDGNSRYFEPADGRNWSAGLRVIKQF
ncbi:TonB-dependent receptor [Acinetobacter baumannii]|uniref:TonB-dependent receptor n=4 Tax=Acinetobacter calcoaceticus/baumannii complex TaxID=909768 RepID=A0A1S2G6S6_ACIBA|nr:TonB-dependent receptor [Acinetobacter baumannii]AYX88503.1 TonB-dependent receptor [Acinetobacter baumannii]EXE19788.1 tonB dependent receptor family protein [Acinetobacter baumannii 1106579]EXE81723.1 tonB dependent receptor family protein [Acinetobacter baumannii 83444]KMV26709.1 tonB dependent receptor family protein [Acinetobacter baumannii]KQF73035.1 TonB-dependent receptor [Acinetobacter baumannii]